MNYVIQEFVLDRATFQFQTFSEKRKITRLGFLLASLDRCNKNRASESKTFE